MLLDDSAPDLPGAEPALTLALPYGVVDLLCGRSCGQERATLPALCVSSRDERLPLQLARV